MSLAGRYRCRFCTRDHGSENPQLCQLRSGDFVRFAAMPVLRIEVGDRRLRVVLWHVRETCAIRNWSLWAFNIRTNHVHSVVSATCKPEVILRALKANATRSMRETGCWNSERSPWVYRGSKRYLWTERELLDAIAYVLYDQGEPLQNPER